MSDIINDISIYGNWSSYSEADIHVDGIFFDAVPSQYSDGVYTNFRSLSVN